MLRTLLNFFLIGGLLFGAKVFVEGRLVEGPEITVAVPADATQAQVDQAIREGILLHEARRYGWDQRDPIVFTHLVRNMRFVDPDSTDTDLVLYQRALEMNMQAHDPVVRSRLLYRAGESLGYVPEDRMPTPEQLEAHLQAHADRFERESRVRFQQVFLSRSKRGDALRVDAAAMQQQLSALGDGAPEGLGDPLPGLRSEQSATPSQIEDDYGIGLARAIEESATAVWSGPAESVYGLHFLRIIGKDPAYVPPLDIIVAEVRADRVREIRDELKQERMDALRQAYTVHVQRVP